VDSLNEALRAFLVGRGFAIEEGGGLVEVWLPASDRPSISSLAEGYTLCCRIDADGRTHHMANRLRNHQYLEARLQQTSLYRPDLDLVVYNNNDDVVAYGLF